MIFVKKLYVEAINDILAQTPDAQAFEVADKLVDFYYSRLVSDNDQKLINIAFNKNLKQEQLDAFLSEWDIEVAGGYKALLLSYVMKMRSDLKFDAYAGPRLAGLLNFYRFKNLQLISHYTKIGKELNKKGIVPMILKGGAMKFLRPELSRTMGDIDILVDGVEAYKSSCKTAMELGYEYENNEHSIDLHLPNSEEGICDIHRSIEIGEPVKPEFIKRLFARAERKNIFGVETCLPTIEDMVFICLTNMVKNIRDKTSVAGILYALFDVEYLQNLKPDFDWNKVRANIEETNSYAVMYLAVKFVNRLAPNVVPEELIKNEKLEKCVRNSFNKDVFYSRYIHDIKYVCKELRLKNSLRSWDAFKGWCKVKIPHFFLKRIYKSQALINLTLSLVK